MHRRLNWPGIRLQHCSKVVSTGLKGINFAGQMGFRSGCSRRLGNTPPRPLGWRSLTLASSTDIESRLNEYKQVPAGALSRRGFIETRRTRWLSRVNPRAGPWSLGASPRSYRPVSPSEKLPAISSHSVGRSTLSNRSLGDFQQMMIKRQEESSRVSLCGVSDD